MLVAESDVLQRETLTVPDKETDELEQVDDSRHGAKIIATQAVGRRHQRASVLECLRKRDLEAGTAFSAGTPVRCASRIRSWSAVQSLRAPN